jgi:formylglycine-generating enzyme required for sulfatase activity
MRLDTLCQRLRSLDALLRRDGMLRGPDVWQSVYDLLVRLDAQGRLPDDERWLAPLLGPLLCRNPEEQRRFPRLFEEWLTVGRPQAPEAIIRSPLQPERSRWWQGLNTFDRRWRIATLLLLLAILGVAALILTKPPPEPIAKPELVRKEITPAPIAKKPDKTPNVPIIDRVSPNRLPVPVVPPPAWQVWQTFIGYFLAGLPGGLTAWGLLYHYRRRMRLEKLPGDGDEALNQVQFAIPLAPIFGGGQARGAFTALRPAYWQTTRRLDVQATVEATAHGAGFFQPRYRSRRRVPVYLLLVRSLDRDDQRAAWAEELTARFEDAGIAVQSYRFRDDPRWLKPWRGARGSGQSLAQLANEHGDARLLVLSEAEILFHPLNGQPRPWLDDFSPWRQRVWLHPRDAALPHAELLWKNQFLMLPLDGASLHKLAAWLGSTAQTLPEPTSGDMLPLPETIRDEPEAWLSPHLPYGAEPRQLFWELRWYLGTHGLLLLRALAVYPEPRWHLTLALDYLLFAEKEADQPERREQRLARISRLPWLRHAHFPEYLREALLRQADKDDLARVRWAWQSLFGQLTDRASAGTLKLDMALPSRRRLRRWLADLRGSRKAGALNDPIFANILLGGKLGLFDFHLPRVAARLLRGRRGWLEGLTLAGALLLAIGGGYGAALGWEKWGKPALTAYWNQDIVEENARWPVAVYYRENTQDLAKFLETGLAGQGFKVNATNVLTGKKELPRNRITYPPGAEAVAQRLARHIRHVMYGAALDVQPGQGDGAGLEVLLLNTYQPLATFSDALAVSGTDAPAAGVFRDTLKDGSQGPEMVVIPAGQFQMGSPENEKGRSDDEGPQHPVTMQSFAMGKTEVTFAEYEVFAKATNRKLPGDVGWGRGNRPVINVSWEDAVAYSEWLSEQTGQTYRLPTEAEWEYAARAGTQALWFWGADEGQTDRYAWFNENSNSQTHPVGEKQANAFGLHDTAGNVWEWAEDCWHENYQGAPADGKAWLETNGGECVRRVVRGGSWGDGPQLLRSAFRGGVTTGGALNFRGFRLARAL